MKFTCLALMSVLCTSSLAIPYTKIAAVSITLFSLNEPVSGFFGMFRRRKAPIQETTATPEPQSFPFMGNQGGFFNPGGFGNLFFPSGNTPMFGMFGQNRFPPQFGQSQQAKPQQLRPQSQPMLPPQRNPIQQFPPQNMQQFPPQQFPPQSMQQFPQSMQSQEFDMDNFRDPREDDIPGMNTEEAESFFTLLSETDESKCISRLVCEMGANPSSGGEFGQTIADIIGGLNDFPVGSKVSEYNEILNIGVAEGLSSCLSKFSVCDEESYQMVKKAQVDDEENK